MVIQFLSGYCEKSKLDQCASQKLMWEWSGGGGRSQRWTLGEGKSLEEHGTSKAELSGAGLCAV